MDISLVCGLRESPWPFDGPENPLTTPCAPLSQAISLYSLWKQTPLVLYTRKSYVVRYNGHTGLGIGSALRYFRKHNT